jgi:carbon storage regulator
MLVLSRKIGEEVVIGGDIRIRVLAIQGQRVRLGITAPVAVPVWREEKARAAEAESLPPRGGVA